MKLLRKRRKLFAWIAGVIVALAVLSQLFLPSIAATFARSWVKGYATDVHISISATPAIKLLFGHADTVDTHIGVLHADGRVDVTKLLARANDVTNVNATVGQLFTPQGIEFDNVSLTKRGSQISTDVTISRTALQAALPSALTVGTTGVNASSITVEASITLLGQTLSATGVIEPHNGAVDWVPQNPLLPTILVFQDPSVYIDSLQASIQGDSYIVSAQAHLTS